MNGKSSHLENREFYRGKRVFVSGHTGYKGAWLTAILHELGAEMTGYALAPAKGCLFEKMSGENMCRSVIGDIREVEKVKAAVRDAQPEILFHLAAQAIVNDCFENPHYTYETNVMGTVNIFEAIRECPAIKSVVIITTDKVYENKGDGAVYVETDPLGGIDPYSSSKTCMEYIADTYKRSYLQTDSRMVGVSTVRASNVLGGGDHISSRLIPSILNSIAAGKPVELRNPHQTRPWQSMLDALNGYMTIGRLMYKSPENFSSQWNIGPTRDGIRSVLWVVEQIRKHYESVSYTVGDTLAVTESKTLGLDIGKSIQRLDWEPIMSCDKMLYNVVDFFKRSLAGDNERDICVSQIREFFEIEVV